MGSGPVVQEAVLPWELRFARRETVQETVQCLLTCMKPTRLQQAVDRMRQNLRVNSNGAQRVATYGSIKAAVTIRSAEKEVPVTEELVGGLTTSQVSS